MENKEIKQKISEGFILTRVIIEILGKPKKHVDDTLKGYINTIEKNKDTIIIKKHIAKAKPHEEGLFSTFVELEILFKNLNNMVYFCFDYMPSSVEIMEPEKMIYKARDLTSFINDLQARLHNVDMTLKTLKQQNIKLNEGFAKIVKNFLVVACISKKTIIQLEKIMGMDDKPLLKVIDILIKEQRIKKDGDFYYTVK